MKLGLLISKAAAAGAARNVERRRSFEMLLAAALPALLTVATAALTVWLGDLTNDRGRRDHSQILTPLMTAGAVVLAAAILLDLRALERLATCAADIRGLLATSSLGSLAFLAVWVTDQARRDEFQDAGATVLFLCLPTLSICGIFLWSTAREIKRLPLRALLLALFVLATVWVEEQCRVENRGDVEERMYMLNSLLVAFVVALRLGVWGATEFSSTRKASHA